jgi:uncharacterized protein YcbX
MTDILVSRIVVYPIKSLDGLLVESAMVLPSGALEHDREFSLSDRDGRWINGKRDGRINAIRSEYDLDAQTVRLRSPLQSDWKTFHLIDQQHELENWFSALFEIPVHLKRDQHSGFPDDSFAKGPTIISTGTIRELSSWFAILDENETRRRFRTNIEISSDTPFWEDQLFGRRNHDIAFRLGDVEIFGVGPCKRCVVPTRDSGTGEVTPAFEETFVSKRASTLPAWATRARFGPLFYRVAVNTRVNSSDAGKRISVGDRLRLSIVEKT